MKLFLCRFALFIFLFLPIFTLNTTLPAFDSAADPVYNAGWTDGSNGGSGITPWSITTNADSTHFAGTFIGDAGASGVNPDVNTDGRAFGMYTNTPPDTSGASVSAMRDFAGRPLLAGRSFSLDIAINYRDGSKGILLDGDATPFVPLLEHSKPAGPALALAHALRCGHAPKR